MPPLGGGRDFLLLTRTLLFSGQQAPGEGGAWVLAARDKSTGALLAEIPLPGRGHRRPDELLGRGPTVHCGDCPRHEGSPTRARRAGGALTDWRRVESDWRPLGACSPCVCLIDRFDELKGEAVRIFNKHRSRIATRVPIRSLRTQTLS